MGAITPAFVDAMRRLMGLKFAPVDLTTHWEALNDLTDVELNAAVVRSQRDCDEFPSPKMLRAFVDEHRASVIVPEEDPARLEDLDHAKVIRLPDGTELQIDRRWNYYCDVCSDTGVRSFWCGDTPSNRQPWLVQARCNRRGVHGDHEWVETCPCAETNPDVKRKKLRAQQVTRKQIER